MRVFQVIVCYVLIALGGYANASVHILPSAQDYLLKTDLELSSGQILAAGTQWYRAPDIERLRKELAAGTFAGDAKKGRLILFGYDLVNNTYATIGDGRKDGKPSLAEGKIINCTSCHGQSGTTPYAWPFFRTLTHFGLKEQGDRGEYFGGLGYHRDARLRARDCGRECGSIVVIPTKSFEMDALIAWLIAVRDGVYPGEGILIPAFKTLKDVAKIPGSRIPLFPNILEMKADPVAGTEIFKNSCAGCHGEDGLGQWEDGVGFVFPPLAGSASFSHAGGPFMIPVGAAFIKHQMPLTSPGALTDQEALNVMGYVATLPRDSVWWQTYYFQHSPCSRPPYLPLNVGAVPKGFPFSAEQTQFGPWKPIADWLASDTCKNLNPSSTPSLGEGFEVNKSKKPRVK